MHPDLVHTVCQFIQFTSDKYKQNLSMADTVTGLVLGLRLAALHPEYALALSQHFDRQFKEDNEGQMSWPELVARTFPQAIPIEGVFVEDKSAEANQ